MPVKIFIHYGCYNKVLGTGNTAAVEIYCSSGVYEVRFKVLADLVRVLSSKMVSPVCPYMVEGLKGASKLS